MKGIFGMLLSLVLAASLFPVSATASLAAEAADAVYVNGNIYTCEPTGHRLPNYRQDIV